MKKVSLILFFFCQLLFAELKTVYRVYTVKPGDTFYKISTKFYNTPDRWKEIWEYNKYIKNPNWIFPGDELIVPTYVEVKEKKVEKKEEKKEVKPEVLAEKNADVFIAPYYRDMNPPFDFKYDGEIIDFVDKDIILQTQHSKIIIDVGTNLGVKLGDVFNIYRPGRKVIHPETKEIIGVVIKKIGQCKIVDNVETESSIAIILTSSVALKKGDLVKKAE